MLGEYNYLLLSFVFMRMSGCIMFNPIFGRRNVPAMLKVGLTLFLSFFTYSLIPVKAVEITSILVYVVILMKELLVGFVVGYLMQMFLAVILLGGEIMDLQIGVSMSKIYDPASNVSMPMTGSILNAMWMLIFFASNGHLALVQIFCQLGTVMPYGNAVFAPEYFRDLAGLFSTILIYAVKMSLPVLAVGAVTEISVGLLMKAVPQINVFVVNIQLKILIGFALILIMVPTFSTFLQRLIELMFDQIRHIVGGMV